MMLLQSTTTPHVDPVHFIYLIQIYLVLTEVNREMLHDSGGAGVVVVDGADSAIGSSRSLFRRENSWIINSTSTWLEQKLKLSFERTVSPSNGWN